MSKFLRLQATANRLLKENGSTYRVRRVTPTKKTPISDGEPITEETPAIALVTPPKSRGTFSQMYVGREGVLNLSKVNDILVGTQGLKFPVKPGDEIFFQDEWWRIEALSPVVPDSKTTIIYKGFIRRV